MRARDGDNPNFTIYMKTIIGPHIGSYGLGQLTEADFYKKSASENRLLTEADIYKASASINIFCEAVFYNRLG